MSSRLEQSVSDLIDTKILDGQAYPGLFVTVGVLVKHKLTATGDGSSHSKLSASPYPGNARMASWLGDVRAGGREAERLMREALGFTTKPRGGSDGNLIGALRALPDLAARLEDRRKCPRGPAIGTDSRELGVRHGIGCQVVSQWPCVVDSAVTQWADRAREMLDLVEAWVPVPQPPPWRDPDTGQVHDQSVTCPHCQLRSLRWRPIARRMMCANVACLDEVTGKRPEWSAEDLQFLARDTFERAAS